MNSEGNKDMIRQVLEARGIDTKIVVDKPEATQWDVYNSDGESMYCIRLQKDLELTLMKRREVRSGVSMVDVITFANDWNTNQSYSRVFVDKSGDRILLFLVMDSDLRWFGKPPSFNNFITTWTTLLFVFQIKSEEAGVFE